MMNVRNTVLYVGVTSDLISRVQEHKTNHFPRSFTARYNIHKLVYFEMHATIEDAINREKQLKKWKRLWKLDLIRKNNSELVDLFPQVLKDWGYL